MRRPSAAVFLGAAATLINPPHAGAQVAVGVHAVAPARAAQWEREGWDRRFELPGTTYREPLHS